MFACAAQPGLSTVLLELMNLDGAALRCRSASQLMGGDGRMGGLVGLTMGDSACVWEDAVLVGVCADADDKGGLAPADDYVIKPDDALIFVSASSMPRPARVSVAAAAAGGAPLASSARKGRGVWDPSDPTAPPPGGLPRRSITSLPKNILICGWREKWKFDRAKV